MKIGKFRLRLACSSRIDPELSIMKTMSRSLFTDSSKVGAVEIIFPLGSGTAGSSSVRPQPAAANATAPRDGSDQREPRVRCFDHAMATCD